MIKNFIINIPSNIKMIFWKNKNKDILYVYLISEKKKYFLNFWNNLIKIDKWTNSLVIYKNKNNIYFSNYDSLTKNFFKNFFNSWNLYYFNKIKFKGKGFRIKFFKRTKIIKFYFGRSHKTFMFLKNLIKKRINKYKFIILGLNKQKMLNLSKKITKIKKINKYTMRGLRLSRQLIYKRKGKKGTYI